MDAGADAHVHDRDGGTDAGASDGGPRDAGPTPCGDTVCGGEEACVRGVCVQHCGQDASGWDDALAAGLVPIASVCRSASARATHATGSSLEVWDVTTSMAGNETTFVLSRWPLTDVGVVVEVARTSHDTGSADTLLFPGSYLTLSPAGRAAAFGFTTSADFDGTVFHVLSADGTETELAAPGNFDAAWLDESTLLVNGLGLGTSTTGQGLHAAVLTDEGVSFVQVAEGLGIASGGVRVTDAFVLVGGFFEGFESRAYVLDRALVEDVVAGRREVLDVEAAATSGTRGVHRVAELPSTFAWVHDLVVVQEYDASFSIAGLRAFPVTAYDVATGLTLGPSELLTTGAAFSDALAAGSDRILLSFGAGVLLVER
jgi:hypothetical protein